MLKLALVGKNIAHSKSQELYEKLLGEKIFYSLLDYPSEKEIPSAVNLLSLYRGISITSPYKRHFLDQVEMENEIRELGAINTLGLFDGKIKGTNTDYLALRELLDSFPLREIAVLGDGVMAGLCKIILQEKKKTAVLFSRKTHPNLSDLDLNSFSLVINCCARDFLYSGKLKKQTLFWDMNYHLQHKGLIENYVDGLNLLEKQASLALAFWEITS